MRIIIICLLITFSTANIMHPMERKQQTKPKSLNLKRYSLKHPFNRQSFKKSKSAPEIGSQQPIIGSPRQRGQRCYSNESVLYGTKDCADPIPALIVLTQKEQENGLFKILLDRRYDINVQDYQGDTPLMWAIRKENIRIIKLFLMHPDIDINCTNKSHYTPLHYAVSVKNPKIVKLLLACQNIQPNKKNVEGYTALHCAAKMDLCKIIDILICDPRVTLNIYDKQNKMPHDLIAKDPIGSEHTEKTEFRKKVFARYTVDFTIDVWGLPHLENRLMWRKLIYEVPRNMVQITDHDLSDMINLIKSKTHDCWVPDYVDDAFIEAMIIARFKGITPVKQLKMQ